mgnify:CR=1 FL=1
MTTTTDPRDEDLFKKFSARNAEGGVTRSYAHAWCGHTAVAWCVEALWKDETAPFVLAIADHHQKGDRVHRILELYRDGDQIRVTSADGDYMIASFYTGPVGASAELAFTLGQCAERHNGLVFRQP